MLPTPTKWKTAAVSVRPEKIVERYYPRLLEWAAFLTREGQARSEDIVHDLYLYMALAKPDLSHVENLDNYLYQSLRHVYLAAVTRAARESLQTVTTADFDSIRGVLWARPNHDILQQQNELRRICCYATWRKAQMKGASYFVLRFFHGYTLHEIATIAGLPLSTIQPKLSEARADVRAYIADSHHVRLVGKVTPPEPVELWNSISWPKLFLELRAMILNARKGECLSEWELAKYFRSAVPKPVPSARLSHIASCEQCLALIDSIFQRPTLKDREPLDGVDGPNGTRADDMGSRSRSALLRRAESLRKEVYDHRPQILSIAVNGKIVASLDIQAQRNGFSAHTEGFDEAPFVEVLSEQGLQLALLWFDEIPPQGSSNRRQRVCLSDDRWVDLEISFDGTGLKAEAIYFAPELAAVGEPAILEAIEDVNEEFEPDAVQMEVDTSVQSFHGGHLSSPDAENKASARSSRSKSQPWFGLLAARLRTWFNAYKLAMNPIFTTALVLAAGSVLCFLIWWHQPPNISANALLIRAEKWDSAPQNPAMPGVIYQKVQIRTGKRTVNREIYRDAQGVRTLRHQELASDDALLRDKLADADVDWNQPLSAGGYQDWHDHQRVREDSITRAGSHLLSLTTKLPDGPVREQTLTVRDSDFHPVERTIRFRDDEQVEIAELSYEELPWSKINPNLFNPIASTGGMTSLPSLPLKVFAMPSEGQLDEAELSARLVLNQLRADTGEQIEIIRDPSGIVVKGVVETEQRRRELDDRLYMLPHVTASISSIEALKAKPSQVGELSSVKVIEMQTQATPLETYYLAHGRSIAPVGDLAQHLFNLAYAINLESRAIDDLQHRFAHEEAISTVASSTLTDLLFTHKHKLLAALKDEEKLLTDAQIEAPRSRQTASSNGTDFALATLAERNLALAKELALSKGGNGRSAETIAWELTTTMSELNRFAHEMQVVPQNSAKLDKKK
jgi:DNA-directed RNA polymerase specialized sigma24 family protein